MTSDQIFILVMGAGVVLPLVAMVIGDILDAQNQSKHSRRRGD